MSLQYPGTQHSLNTDVYYHFLLLPHIHSHLSKTIGQTVMTVSIVQGNHKSASVQIFMLPASGGGGGAHPRFL